MTISMGCLSSRCSEDHEHSPASTKVEVEETNFTESEAHAQMIIDVKDGQEESKDCLQGLDTTERDLEEEKMVGETEISETEAQLTTCSPVETTGELDATQSSAQRSRCTAKSVTLSMAESKDPRYWAQDLKG